MCKDHDHQKKKLLTPLIVQQVQRAAKDIREAGGGWKGALPCTSHGQQDTMHHRLAERDKQGAAEELNAGRP